jgi:hypothetical protein
VSQDLCTLTHPVGSYEMLSIGGRQEQHARCPCLQLRFAALILLVPSSGKNVSGLQATCFRKLCRRKKKNSFREVHLQPSWLPQIWGLSFTRTLMTVPYLTCFMNLPLLDPSTLWNFRKCWVSVCSIWSPWRWCWTFKRQQLCDRGVSCPLPSCSLGDEPPSFDEILHFSPNSLELVISSHLRWYTVKAIS